MRRLWSFSLCLAGVALGVSPARAQTARVSVSLSLASDATPTGARRPLVQVRNLIADPRWAQALDASLPIILNYTLEIWRSRDGWIDELIKTTEWQTVITKEPLQDEYTVTVVQAKPIVARFANRDSAARYLGFTNRVDVAPDRPGNFYYTLTLRITALSDADLDEVERFLQGDPSANEGHRTMLSRGLRRLLLRIAGLPSEELQAKSDRFEVKPPE